MKKRILVAAIGASLGAASLAQADGLLFPFYQSQPEAGIYSFLMLANVQGVDADRVHYIWNFDRLDTPATECVHEDLDGSLTAWDLAQQTVDDPVIAGHNIDLPDGFGDGSNIAYSVATPPTRGFMIVTNYSDYDNVAATPPTAGFESTLAGQMIVVNADVGVVTNYRGMNNPGSLNDVAAGTEGDWNSIFTSHRTYDLTWYPQTVVNTQWYVLVTGTNMDNPTNWQGAGTIFNGFNNVFDRDEVPRSGQLPAEVVCHRIVERSNIMTPEQVTHSNNGGYMWAIFRPSENGDPDDFATPGDSTGVLMTKIETTVPTILGGVATSGLDNPWPNLPF